MQLELALWKAKMVAENKNSNETEGGYRSRCRCICLSDFVVEHVMEFLWDGKDVAERDLTVFPWSI